MTKTYIVAAKRTAIGKFLGTTLSMTAADLGAAVIKNIIAETGVNPANIDEVIVGNVLSAGQGQGVARQASIKGGIPQEVPAYGINMICGSGMKAVLNGAGHIDLRGVKADAVSATLGGAGIVALEGKARRASAVLNGAGTIDLQGLRTDLAPNCSVTGVGKILQNRSHE